MLRSALWAPKGGAGTTVTAALLAAACEADVLLVDLAGDLPRAVGCSDPAVGLTDLPARSVTGPRRSDGHAWQHVEVPVADGVGLLPRGGGDLDPVALVHLLDELAVERREVVIDVGTVPVPRRVGAAEVPALARSIADRVDRSLVVVRACYLALTAAVALLPEVPTDGCVLVAEPGRALEAGDVATVLGVPVVAQVPVTPQVARAVDAGLLLHRPHRPTLDALRSVA